MVDVSREDWDRLRACEIIVLGLANNVLYMHNRHPRFLMKYRRYGEMDEYIYDWTPSDKQVAAILEAVT